MTKEEAIAYLEDAKSDLPYKFGQALDMAIKALQINAVDVAIGYNVEYLPDKNGIHQAKATITKAEVVQGEWIFNPTDAIDLMFAKPKCSKCGFESSDGGNFCPNCGAKMKGGENEVEE